MKFVLKKSSDWGFRDEVEIDSLESLVEFIRAQGDDSEIILGESGPMGEKKTLYIEIYDGYRE